MEKYRLARSGLPSPMVRATTALPPEPSIKPAADRIMDTGKMIFTADRAFCPTRLETNRPSTTLYTEVKIIMIIEGRVKRSSLLYVKWSESLICIFKLFLLGCV